MREDVYKRCGHNALLLEDGDHKTLEAGGFATTRGKELLPGMQNLPSTPKETICLAARTGKPVKVKRVGATEVGRGHLWRVSDLSNVLPVGGR